MAKSVLVSDSVKGRTAVRSLAAGQLDCLRVSCPYVMRLTDSLACLAYAVVREWVSFELSEAVQQQRSAQAIDETRTTVNRAGPRVFYQQY